MMKKMLAFAAAALFSLNASAGYVQYDLHHGASNGGLNGYVVQHDTDQSIAYFAFFLNDPAGGYGQQFFPFSGEGAVLLTSASTYFQGGGPTNFTIRDDFGGDHDTDLSVTFARTATGDFTYTADYTANLWANMPPAIYAGTVSGLAIQRTVDRELADYLDSIGGYEFGVPRIVPAFIAPNPVPEPASLALFALGAAGIAGARRRRPAR